MLVRVVKAIVAGLVICGSIASAQASSISLVTGDDYAPFTDQKLPEGGMLTEVVKAVYAKIGKTPDIKFMPWKRGYADAEEGKFVATFPYVRNEDRAKAFHYSDPLFVIKQKVYTAKSANFGYSTPDSLKGKTVCNPLGYALAPAIAPLVESGAIKKQEPQNLGACAQMVAAGRADFFVIDDLVGSKAVAEVGKTDEVVTSKVSVSEQPLSLIVSKKLPDGPQVVEEFNKALAALKADGTYDKIVAKHTK